MLHSFIHSTLAAVQPQAPAYTMTPGRLAASVAALLALTGVIVGGVALARSARRIGGNGRRGAIVALILGPIGVVVGGLVVARADGGLGSGSGIAGGVVAVTLGMIGIALARLALARSRRTH